MSPFYYYDPEADDYYTIPSAGQGRSRSSNSASRSIPPPPIPPPGQPVPPPHLRFEDPLPSYRADKAARRPQPRPSTPAGYSANFQREEYFATPYQQFPSYPTAYGSCYNAPSQQETYYTTAAKIAATVATAPNTGYYNAFYPATEYMNIPPQAATYNTAPPRTRSYSDRPSSQAEYFNTQPQYTAPSSGKPSHRPFATFSRSTSPTRRPSQQQSSPAQRTSHSNTPVSSTGPRQPPNQSNPQRQGPRPPPKPRSILKRRSAGTLTDVDTFKSTRFIYLVYIILDAPPLSPPIIVMRKAYDSLTDAVEAFKGEYNRCITVGAGQGRGIYLRAHEPWQIARAHLINAMAESRVADRRMGGQGRGKVQYKLVHKDDENLEPKMAEKRQCYVVCEEVVVESAWEGGVEEVEYVQ